MNFYYTAKLPYMNYLQDGKPAHLPKRGGNRRVDRILYSHEHPIELIDYNFISSFTRLTDHIPISMKFKCN
jgi:hypothetical protein